MKRISSNRKKHGLAMAIAFCMTAPLAQANDIDFSGFLSVGGGFVDDENNPGYNGYTEEDLTFDKNLLGLQVTGKVNDKLSATAQLIARSENNYEVSAEWAYLTWQATDSIKVRAGRLRTPFYMYSDFLDVGYAYSWIRPPSEVYYLPINNVEGIDFYATKTVGIFDTSFQAYFGGIDDELTLGGTLSEAKTRNQMGVAGTLGKDWWTLRAAYHQADFSIDLGSIAISPTATIGSLASTLTALGYRDNAARLLLEEDDAVFTEFGINIDTGRFVAAAEYVEFDPGDAVLSKNIRQFVMAGVRAGSWLFHVTGSQAKDEATNPAAGITPNQAMPVFGNTSVLIGTLDAIAASQVTERDVVSLGVRWDVASSTALKFQLDDVDNKGAGDQKVLSVALQTVF